MSSLSDHRCYSLGDCVEWLQQSDPEPIVLTSNNNNNRDKTTMADNGDCHEETNLDKTLELLTNNDESQQQQPLNNNNNNLSDVQESDEKELRALRKRLKEWKEENEINFPKRRKKIISSYANLIGAYEYGLQKISKLTDLSNAPDNVMDGNNYCIQNKI